MLKQELLTMDERGKKKNELEGVMAKGGQARQLRAKKEGGSAVGVKPWSAGRDSKRGQREEVGDEKEKRSKILTSLFIRI